MALYDGNDIFCVLRPVRLNKYDCTAHHTALMIPVVDKKH